METTASRIAERVKHGGARTKKRRDAKRSVSAIEFVMLTPLAFFMIMMTVQFALYVFSRHVAIAAAQEGARVARTEYATEPTAWVSDAQTKASAWVTQLAPSLGLPGGGPVAQDVGRIDGVENVQVTVQVSVPSIIPWTSTFTVTESSQGPVEQFVPDNGG
jgi:Flp pilus assembly protein TadG